MCREQLPVWQEFYTKYQNDDIEVVTVAIDAQGAEKARPYVKKANATYITLVDESNRLSQLFSFKAIPNVLLMDGERVLNYWKLGGFDIRKKEFAAIVEAWVKKPTPEWLAQQTQADPRGGPNHDAAIDYFQRGLDYYHYGNVNEALLEWKIGRDLEPDNWVIRKQIWAVEHPEKFYDGDVDLAWQKGQIEQGT